MAPNSLVSATTIRQKQPIVRGGGMTGPVERSEVVLKNWWEIGLKNRWQVRLMGGELSDIAAAGRLAPQTSQRWEVETAATSPQ